MRADGRRNPTVLGDGPEVAVGFRQDPDRGQAQRTATSRTATTACASCCPMVCRRPAPGRRSRACAGRRLQRASRPIKAVRRGTSTARGRSVSRR
jgi:hypothetical protein